MPLEAPRKLDTYKYFRKSVTFVYAFEAPKNNRSSGELQGK